MATPATKLPISGLARSLVKEGLLSEADAHVHYDESLKKRMPIVRYLVANKIIDSLTIAKTVSKEFGLPLFDLNAIALGNLPLKLVNEKLIRQHHVLPLLKRGNRLFLAVSDPTCLQALDEIKFNTRLSTESIVVEDDKLTHAIDNALEAADTSMRDLMDADLDNLEVTGGDEDEQRGSDADTSEIDDAPIVRFVNKILLDAIKKGASDIHVEPDQKFFRIRFRQDGMLHEIASPPANLASRLSARLKVMSRMDIAERRIPQDGRIKMAISKNRSIDFRVNTCPTLYGEKVVLRILDPTSA